MSYAVQHTPEFLRVFNLPRRPHAPTQAFAELLTQHLKTTAGTMTLFPTQAFALAEAHDNNGLFGPIPVGEGKTLISILANTVMSSSRPVLRPLNMTSSQLLPKFWHDVKTQRVHWRFDETKIRAISYDTLSNPRHATILDDLAPDLFILDEAHKLSGNSSRTRRFLKYLKAHPDTRLVVLSGTIMRKSLMDFWQLLRYTLGTNCPLPLRWNEIQDWDSVLGSNQRPGTIPRKPGALMKFCNPGEGVKEGYARRFLETPGIVGSTGPTVTAELVLRERPAKLPSSIASVLYDLRQSYRTPWGEELEDVTALWRIARQLAVGFYYKWLWPGGKTDHEWLEARRNWHRDLRDVLRRNISGQDSPALVGRAILAGKIDVRTYWAWHAVKGRYKPTPPVEAVWLSDCIVDDAAAWLQEHRGIVWYEHKAFGERLAQKYNIPHYGAGKKASTDILTESRPMVASIMAHGTGKDLQHYNANLLVCAPSSGKTFEQLLARTHRLGQRAETVTADMYLHIAEIKDGVAKATQDAKTIEALQQAPQKLCYATRTFT